MKAPAPLSGAELIVSLQGWRCPREARSRLHGFAGPQGLARVAPTLVLPSLTRQSAYLAGIAAQALFRPGWITILLALMAGAIGCDPQHRNQRPKISRVEARVKAVGLVRSEAKEIRADAEETMGRLGSGKLKKKALAAIQSCDPRSIRRCSAYEKLSNPVLRYAAKAIIIAQRVDYWARDAKPHKLRASLNEAHGLVAQAEAAIPAEKEKIRQEQARTREKIRRVVTALARKRRREEALRARLEKEEKALAVAEKKCAADVQACKRACDKNEWFMCVAYGGRQVADVAGLAKAKPAFRRACDGGLHVGCQFLKTVRTEEAKIKRQTARLWSEVEATVDSIASKKGQIRVAQSFPRTRRNSRALGMMRRHVAALITDAYCPAKRAFVAAHGMTEFRRRGRTHCKERPPEIGGLAGRQLLLRAECRQVYASACPKGR